MHVIKLSITGRGIASKDFFEFANFYFHSLLGANQITNEERQFEPIENGLVVNLYCPEKDSYEEKNSTDYGINWRKRIEEELKCKFDFHYVGIDPESGETVVPNKNDFLILKTGGYSPLIDGLSLNQIPLYRIPFTHKDGQGYNDINFWENNFKMIEGLWYNSVVGERWTQNQLQNHDSDLNKQGISCCKKIEDVTRIPTYYFLFNYRAWGQKKDKERKCPNCGSDWFLEGATFNDVFAFKCVDCRLVSELSSNC